MLISPNYSQPTTHSIQSVRLSRDRAIEVLSKGLAPLTLMIANPLSVTTITSNGGGFCDIIAVDGSDYVIVGEDTVTVGPPQPFKFGSCQTD